MQLEMAACGWLGEAWDAAYPEDLPPEWRLDYYSNQFDALLVPAADWLREDDATLEEWLEEVPEGFRLYWELSADADTRRLLHRYQRSAASPAGWILQSGTEPSEELAAELRAVAPLLAPCHEGEWRGGDIAILAVESEPDLRALRQAIDHRAEQGLERLVLLVPPSPRAAQTMEQLHTLCQLYGS